MSVETTSEWNEARLLSLIRDGIQESAELEYKGAGALMSDPRAKEEITKDVSAMANASGGTIIYGIAEYRDSARKHLPEKIDPVDGLKFSKEWLDQIISQINPRIPGLQIDPIPLSTGLNDVAYVVQVPKGSTAHQALTLYYHRRYNFEALRMLDHEIRDVMNRRTHPKIEVSARLIIHPQVNADGEAGRLAFKLWNNSDVFARYVFLLVYAPIKIKGHSICYVGDSITLEETKNGRAYKLAFSNHGSAPFFPQTTMEIPFDFKVASDFKVRGTKPFSEVYRYAVCADSMPRLDGQFTFDQIYTKRDSAPEPWVDAKQIAD